MLTAERIAANRRNAQHSTGPKTAEGKARSRANALKHGLTSTSLVPPDDEALFAERLADWNRTFEPDGPVEEVLVRTAVFASVKLERCTHAEFAQAAQSRRQAIAAWEAQQTERVSQILAAFPEHPAAAVSQLESFCAGCDWIVSAWRSLLEETPVLAEWTDEQIAHAECLLGLKCLDGKAGGASIEEIRACLRGPEAALLIEAELDRLLALRAELWEQQDGPALIEAINLAALDTSPAGALRHRYQVASFQQFFRSLVKLERSRNGKSASASAPSNPAMAALGRLAASGRAKRPGPPPTENLAAPEPERTQNEARAPQDAAAVATCDDPRRPAPTLSRNEPNRLRHTRPIAAASHPGGAPPAVPEAPHERLKPMNVPA